MNRRKRRRDGVETPKIAPHPKENGSWKQDIASLPSAAPLQKLGTETWFPGSSGFVGSRDPHTNKTETIILIIGNIPETFIPS